MDKFLSSGKLTQPTPIISNITSGFQSTGIESIFEILSFLMKSEYKELNNQELSNIHMKRSANDILESMYFTSCTDYGIVFCTLARLKKVPTKFAHYVDIEAFKLDQKNLSLHVFCECYINNLILFINPQKGLVQNIINVTDYRHLLKRNGKDYILGYEGLDNADAGINSEEKLLKYMHRVAIEVVSR